MLNLISSFIVIYCFLLGCTAYNKGRVGFAVWFHFVSALNFVVMLKT